MSLARIVIAHSADSLDWGWELEAVQDDLYEAIEKGGTPWFHWLEAPTVLQGPGGSFLSAVSVLVDADQLEDAKSWLLSWVGRSLTFYWQHGDEEEPESTKLIYEVSRILEDGEHKVEPRTVLDEIVRATS